MRVAVKKLPVQQRHGNRNVADTSRRKQQAAEAPQEYRRGPGAQLGSHQSIAALYGDALEERHLQCLQRLAQSANLKDENLTSLIVFHLVEMGLMDRDAEGEMRVTPLGAALLSEYRDRLLSPRVNGSLNWGAKMHKRNIPGGAQGLRASKKRNSRHIDCLEHLAD